jgi:site-specific DNA-methyltransferase (adenine-specific)
VDILTVPRVPRNVRVHGAQKPIDILIQLIEATTLPGDLVLDPCCGSGSTLVAARESKRSAIGFEKDKDYYTSAFANVHSGDLPNAKPAE